MRMTTQLTFVVSVSLLALFSAAAQQQPDVVLRNHKFTFGSSDFEAMVRNDRFCLPANERLVEIKKVNFEPGKSNSSVSVLPDLTANCINVIVNLPPAQKVCTDIPMVRGFQVKMESKCIVISRPFIEFDVEYTAIEQK
jgi:hypothetical protein